MCFEHQIRRCGIYLEQYVSVKVAAAINSMNKAGHYARVHRYQSEMWVEIDQCMLASFDEIEELVDGVRSFEELADLFKRSTLRNRAAFSRSIALF